MKSHVLCIVTDNASNTISTLEKLNIEQEETEKSELEIVDINAGTSEELKPEEEELDLNKMILEMQDLSEVHYMHCGVHALKLAIWD